MSTPQRPAAKIPIRLPFPVALALLAAMAACIAYAWPLLLTMTIRRGLPPVARYAVSALFAAATLGFASYLATSILPATDHRIIYQLPIQRTTLYVVPALFAWGASAFAWAGVGALGSAVALAAAAAWGLKPMYATWTSSSGFWTEDNPTFYGAGMGLIVMAVLLVVVQVMTIRTSASARAA